MKVAKLLILTLCVVVALALAAGIAAVGNDARQTDSQAISAAAECSKLCCEAKQKDGKCPAKDANDCPKKKDPNSCPDKKAASFFAAEQPTALACCEGKKKEGCPKEKADPNAPAKCPNQPAEK